MSRDRVFRDRNDEGEEWLSDATVAGKRWSLTLNFDIAEALVGSQLNAYVSTPSGDTSEFAPLTTQESASPRVVYVSTRDGNPELYVVDGAVNGGSFGAPRPGGNLRR